MSSRFEQVPYPSFDSGTNETQVHSHTHTPANYHVRSDHVNSTVLSPRFQDFTLRGWYDGQPNKIIFGGMDGADVKKHILCEYCSSKNVASDLECWTCGGPLPL